MPDHVPNDAPAQLSDDLIADEPSHGPSRSAMRSKFSPWHKVRKQFIRSRQWNKQILENYLNGYLRNNYAKLTIDDNSSPPTPPPPTLRFFVIPGDDLLDIRSFIFDSEQDKCLFQYLGFNYRYGASDKNSKVYISHNDVVSNERVSDSSNVYRESFENLGKTNSQAFSYFKQFGPYNVVNLDLCSSLFPVTNSNVKTYFSALQNILKHQMHQMRHPWILFITTQTASSEVNADDFGRLCKGVISNRAQHTSFRDRLAKLVPDSAFPQDGLIDVKHLDAAQIMHLFNVAVGKHLLIAGISSEPKWKVKMLPSFHYSIHQSKNIDMVSLAFIFTPFRTNPIDSTGFSEPAEGLPQTTLNEEEMAEKILLAVEGMENADDIINSDKVLHSELLKLSTDLLISAGYDGESYTKWVEGGELLASQE